MHDYSNGRKKLPRKIFFIAGYVLFLFIVLEIFLRVQQRFFKVCDCEFQTYNSQFLSYTLNHKPQSYESYNEDGIQFNELRPAQFPAGIQPIKILFMGDSFIQGNPPQSTVPQYVWEYFQKTERAKTPLLIWNAGYSSYAPLIYTVQAKQLVPKYQPDILIIDIDESDLVDDFALYRPYTKRNDQGETIAVYPSNAFEQKIKGYVAISKLPFCSLRLLSLWLYKAQLFFVYRDYNQKSKSKYLQNPLADTNSRFSFNLVPSFDNSPDAVKKFEPEIRSFEEDLRELMKITVNLMGSPEKVLILYHPHIHQLTPDDRGFLWRNNVAPLLERVSKQYGIRFYNATADLNREFSELGHESYYDRNDMHFNDRGMRSYAECIKAYLIKYFTLFKEK